MTSERYDKLEPLNPNKDFKILGFPLVSTFSPLTTATPNRTKNRGGKGKTHPRSLSVVSCSTRRSKYKYDTTTSRIGWVQAVAKRWFVYIARQSTNSLLCFETTCDLSNLAYKTLCKPNYVLRGFGCQSTYTCF
jgi:hypothetical protein